MDGDRIYRLWIRNGNEFLEETRPVTIGDRAIMAPCHAGHFDRKKPEYRKLADAMAMAA